MIFSEHWMREWVDPAVDAARLVELLTMAGLEVGSCTPVARAFTGVVVGEVQAVTPHPDAERLRVCQVNDGRQLQQVVCGAPNVTPGMKAPFARVGARIEIPGAPLQINKAKLRGIESHGMLCSTAELGLAEKADGLMVLPMDAPVGEDLRTYLGLDDMALELDLTPNRGDCLGIKGLAREIGVLTSTDVTPPVISVVPATTKDVFGVRISAADACPRYLGRVIRNVNPGAVSPFWLQEKLRRCGLRSIDPIVDVTNYILLELGQPLHAFDLDKLTGAIDVRLAQAGERITLLDGKEINLHPDTLVIADHTGAVAMAGIMGGLATAVSESTTSVFLECAAFAPLAIAGRARQYGMHTDASHRYERGVDWNLQQQALERATALLLEVVGGSPGPVIEAVGTLPAPRQVALRHASIERLLGVRLPEAEVVNILSRLGLEIVHADEEGLSARVPSFRFDIEIEADLIEELARVHGYARLPKTGGLQRQTLRGKPEGQTPVSRLKRHLVALGYQEAITYSFIDPQLAAMVQVAGTQPVVLENPISSEMSVMRSSLIPGLLATLRYNSNRQQVRARLFESGLVYLQDAAKLQQPQRLAGLVCGSRYPENWNNNKEISDFYDLKGDVESLVELANPAASLEFVAGNHPALQDGQCAHMHLDGKPLGVIGKLHPAAQRALDLPGSVFVFELELAALWTRQLPRFKELSRYPEVSRDLAIVVDRELAAAELLACVRKQAGEFLTDLRIFDVYQGDAIGKNKKSVALGLTWQHPSRTLSDDEISAIITNCVKELEQQFNANLRA